MKKAKKIEDRRALANHRTMLKHVRGDLEFYQEAEAGGHRSRSIGCEVYMAPESHLKKSATSQRESAFHFTLLAQNEQGYRNLVKLVSIAHLDGMYYKPRIDKELLSQHSAGLIGLSGCLKGEINSAIIEDQYPKALELGAATYRDILGADNFFIELHNHGIEAQLKNCNRELPRLGQRTGHWGWWPRTMSIFSIARITPPSTMR